MKIIWGLGLILLASFSLSADQIAMKNGEVYQGVVLEEFPDRVIVNILGKEVHLLKSEIHKISYDDQEKTWLQAGHNYFEKKNYARALESYEKALKINPNSRDVQNAILKVRGLIFREKDVLQQRHVNKLKDIKKFAGNKKTAPQDSAAEIAEEVEEQLGLILTKEESRCLIAGVVPGSPAFKQHLFTQDQIIGIWDQKIAYESLEEIYKQLLSPESPDTRITVQKRIVILRGKKFFFQDNFAYIDAILDYNSEGLIVTSVKKDGRADLAGLKPEDRILQVEGEQTRYLAKEALAKKLAGKEGSRLELIVQRDYVLRRERNG